MSYPPPSSPQRRRPSKWWFVVGGVLLLLAVAVFIGGLIWTVVGATETDGTFTANQEAKITSPAHEERMLFVEDGVAVDPVCTITDGTGKLLKSGGLRGDVSVSNGDGDWRGVGKFDSGDGDLTVSCAAEPGTEMRIGAPLGWRFAAGLAVTLVLPMILGSIGALVLLVTTMLFVTRPSRQTPAAG